MSNKAHSNGIYWGLEAEYPRDTHIKTKPPNDYASPAACGGAPAKVEALSALGAVTRSDAISEGWAATMRVPPFGHNGAPKTACSRVISISVLHVMQINFIETFWQSYPPNACFSGLPPHPR